MATKRLNANIVIGGGVTGSLRSAFTSTSKSLVRMGQEVRKLSTEQRTLERGIQTFGRMGKNVDGLRERYAKVTAQLQKMRAETERLHRIESAREANLSKRAAYRGQLMETAALAMAAAQPIRIAMAFETSMSKVSSVSQASETELASLTAQARELGATTVWSASQAAEGMTFLAMAGLKTNDILGAMPGMLSLASAGGLELGRAADIASNILTGFGLSAEEMGRVSDVMTNAFTASNVTVEMLGDTMKYVAPVASGLGVSLEQAAAMAGRLGDAGIQGSMAGTALRAVLGRLAGPPKKAAEALDELGIKTRDATGNLRDVPTILAELDQATRKLGSATRAQMFKDIAGDEAFSALSILVDQAGSGALQEFAKDMETVGSANRVASQMTDNTRGAIVEMKSAMESLAITVGNVFLPAVRQGGFGLARVVGTVDRLIQSAPMVSKGIVGVVGALTAARIASVALGYAGTFLRGGWLALQAGSLRLASGVRGVGLALQFAGRLALTTPVGLIAAGIAAVGIAIYRNWDRVKTFFGGFWQGLTEGIEPIRSQFQAWADQFPILSKAFDLVSSAVSTVVGWFKQLFTPVEATSEQLESAGRAGQTMGRWIATGIEWALTPMMTLIKSIQWVSNNIGGVITRVQGLAEAGRERVTGAYQNVKSFFGLGDADDESTSSSGAGTPPPVPPSVASGRGNTYRDESTTNFQIVQQPGEDQDTLVQRITAEIERNRQRRERAALNDGAYAQ